MPDNLKKLIGNIGTFGKFNLNKPTNAPSYLVGRQKKYFDLETSVHNQEMAKYSTDYYLASVQGVDYSDFYAYTDMYIRLADAISASSLTNTMEDFKQVLIADSSIDFIGIGAKITTAGNTYLVISPSNTSTVVASALVRRCNTVLHYLDYYGNVQTEPLCWASSKGATATSPENQELMILMNSYQHSVIQCNPATAQLIRENTRIILGDQVYRVRGTVNFIREFTDVENSNHLTHFDLEVTEPSQYDDMENGVAGGLNFEWTISIAGAATMPSGTSQFLVASSLRNGEAPNAALYPVGYVWSSSDENVATVTNSGVLNAISAGECVISCALAQNPNIFATFALTVEATITGTSVAWVSAPPPEVKQFETVTATAAFFENGVATDETVAYSFDGVASAFYGTSVSGNTLSITGYYPSGVPLVITASHGEQTATAILQLIAQ